MSILGNDYMQYPNTVKGLAREIISLFDDYNAKKINNDCIHEVIGWYACSQSDKLFVGDQLNPTIVKIIGKRRVRLLNDLLQRGC